MTLEARLGYCVQSITTHESRGQITVLWEGKVGNHISYYHAT